MQSLKTLKELRGLQGRLAYDSTESIGSLSTFYKVNEKRHLFHRDDACQRVFEDIKEYLIKPPVLIAPISRKLFLLCVTAMDHYLGALFVQNNDKGFEQVIY